jgi:hypothetical protein
VILTRPAFPLCVHRVSHTRDLSLTEADVRSSALRRVRNIVEVIFAFTARATDVVENQFLRVDVTEQFPFLVTKLSPYYDPWKQWRKCMSFLRQKHHWTNRRGCTADVAGERCLTQRWLLLRRLVVAR